MFMCAYVSVGLKEEMNALEASRYVCVTARATTQLDALALHQ
jgi:hypothetical protein